MLLQAYILIFSLAAVMLSQSKIEDRRRFAPLFGLASQPGWVYSTLQSDQWGMVIVSLAYTGIWAYGLWQSIDYWILQFMVAISEQEDG